MGKSGYVRRKALLVIASLTLAVLMICPAPAEARNSYFTLEDGVTNSTQSIEASDNLYYSFSLNSTYTVTLSIRATQDVDTYESPYRNSGTIGWANLYDIDGNVVSVTGLGSGSDYTADTSIGPDRLTQGSYRLEIRANTNLSRLDVTMTAEPERGAFISHEDNESTNSGAYISHAENEQNSGATLSMYRLYNPYTGEHLFTLDQNERDMLCGYGWVYESVAWDSPASSSTPVFRLYNPYSSEHFYTSSESEYAWLASIGWNQEGVSFYSGGRQPIYRLFDPYVTVGTHLYTANHDEYSALGTWGWVPEGTAFYCEQVYVDDH